MGVLGRLKGWLFGKREEGKAKSAPKLPKQEPRQTVIYEDDSSPPEIDEYVDVEITKPAPRAAARDYAKIPMEGTTMVKKKKTTKKKATKKRKPAKRKASKKKKRK